MRFYVWIYTVPLDLVIIIFKSNCVFESYSQKYIVCSSHSAVFQAVTEQYRFLIGKCSYQRDRDIMAEDTFLVSSHYIKMIIFCSAVISLK